MSGFLKFLREKRVSAVAVTHKFRLLYRANSSDVYAFFESTDDAIFYMGEVKRAASGRKIHRFICDGKGGVCNALKVSTQSGKTKNTIFFVDKDLDNFIKPQVPHQRLFQTGYYSIENYIVTDDGFRAIWEEQVQLPVTGETFKRALARFKAGLKHLYSKLRPLTAWVIEQRRRQRRVVLANLNNGLECCFDLKELKLTARADCSSTFRSKCVEGSDDSEKKHVRGVEQELRSYAPKCWVRGKFELWFFIKYLNEVWQSLVGTPISRKKKVKKSLHLSSDNIFGLLSSKIEMPDGLVEFFKANIDSEPA